jgi:HlyD family secretion protein
MGVAALVVLAVRYAFREQPLPVETATLDRGPMQVAISAEGRTRVHDRFVIFSPVEGHLGRIEAREGQKVRKGAALAWITPAPLEIRSERQREASLRAAEADVAAAEARVAQARLNLEQAERESRRVSGLVDSGIRPLQDVEAARTGEASARQELAAATSIVTAASYRADEVRSSLLKSDGQAVAVRSPVDGMVLRVSQESERVVSSGTPIMEVGDPSKLELVFEVLSTDAVRIQPGFDVVVQNWGNDQRSRAKVRIIEPGAFTKVSALGVEEQRVNVIADFCETAPALGDGYRVEGEIVVWTSPDALQVPVSALFRSGAEWNVFVIHDDRAASRTVTIGQRNSQMAEVLKGLSKGDVVVRYPDDRLRPGKLIRKS